MSIVLKQSAGALVKPADDARLYNLLSSGQTGIAEGCEITHLGANQLQIAAGWGICQGRMFTVEQETVSATVSASGQINGRLLIHIDISAESPAVFQAQVAAELPDLIQEDINGSGTVYQIELAVYKIDELAITELLQTFSQVKPGATKDHIHTALDVGAAPVSHTHTKSNITDFPTTLKNPTALTLQLNGTTNQTYDGSAAKTFNVTPSGIGAAATSHTQAASTVTAGTFPVNVKANETARTARQLFNEETRASSTTGTLQSVKYFINVT